MISTRLYQLTHRFRCQGKLNEPLLLNRSDFDQLQNELVNMHCLRALRALGLPKPSFGGYPLAIQEDLAL